MKAIESDASFKQAEGFEGVYETLIDNVSFAVSPEDDGCTTDVMVQKAESAPMFRFEDINRALLAKGYNVFHKIYCVNSKMFANVFARHADSLPAYYHYSRPG